MKKIIFNKPLGLMLALCFIFSMSSEGISAEVLKGKTVNINTATVNELATVPLISQKLAEAVVEYREEMGDFQVIEELLQIDGFSRRLLRKIKTFLLLEGIGGDECTC